MNLPSVNLNFVDGGLGIVAAGAGRAQAKVGPSVGGTPGRVYALGGTTAAKAALVGGPLLEAAMQFLTVAKAPLYVCPTTIDSAGVITSPLTLVGTSVAVVTATLAPFQQIKVKCSTSGAVGTACFQFSVNGGAYGAPVTSVGTSWAYRVPGTFTTLTFAAGSYRSGDVYTIPTTGVVSASVPSGGPDTITQVSSPLDAYQVAVRITTGGARGTAQFSYALGYHEDSQGAVQGNFSSPALTAASFVIPGSGIVLAFSSDTYVLNDLYTTMCVPPSSSVGSVETAINALTADPNQWEAVHVVGTPSSTANAVTLEAGVDGLMQAAAVNQQYLFAVVENPTLGTLTCPSGTIVVDTADTDSVVAAAWAAVASTDGRVTACAGDALMSSPLTGLALRRNCAWAYTARLGASKLSEHPGKIKLGPVPNIISLYRDEFATPALDIARIVTMRTWQGRGGYYFTRGRTLATATSDYSRVMNVRVVDRAATIAVAAFTDFACDDFRADPKTGFIDERDAQLIESSVTGQLQAALMGSQGSSNDEVSDIRATLSRDDNLASTTTLSANITIVTKLYAETINVNIGFSNPALGT